MDLPLETVCHFSERVVKTVTLDWLCLYCHKWNQSPDTVGNYEACEFCGKRSVLVGRYAVTPVAPPSQKEKHND